MSQLTCCPGLRPLQDVSCLSAAAKSRSKPPPFCLAQPRIGTPALCVADLRLNASQDRSRPSFVGKYPSRIPGTPKPAPIFTRKISLSDPCSALGGKPAPSNWSRPASVAQFSVPPKQPNHDALALATQVCPPLRGSTQKQHRSLCLPQPRAPRFVSAQALAESKRRKLTDQFRHIMLRVGSHCLLRSILAESTRAPFGSFCSQHTFSLHRMLPYLSRLVTSYSKQVDAYDKREAVPLPLSLVLAWEHVAATPH